MILPLLFLLAQSNLSTADSTLKIVQRLLPAQTRQRDTTRNDIVIHNDGMNLSATTVHSALRHSRLSYHFFVDRSGRVFQFMSLDRVAEHAGRSKHLNTKQWNDFSIGICLQGSNFVGYTKAQYASLNKLIHNLTLRYKHLGPIHVVGHNEVAYPKGRKSDPGKHFDWKQLHYGIRTVPQAPRRRH
jgi:N-acetyl-anhydromuramyl-L-alanine amidase AmpD